MNNSIDLKFYDHQFYYGDYDIQHRFIMTKAVQENSHRLNIMLSNYLINLYFLNIHYSNITVNDVIQICQNYTANSSLPQQLVLKKNSKIKYDITNTQQVRIVFNLLHKSKFCAYSLVRF